MDLETLVSFLDSPTDVSLPFTTAGMQRIRKVLEEREQEILSEEKEQPCQSDQDGKADSTDEVIIVSHHQESSCAGSSNLSDLIGLLQQQMRSSDWLQKNTAEPCA